MYYSRLILQRLALALVVLLSATCARGALPSGWTSSDIGSPGQVGSASYSSGSSTWTVNGGGTDIWGTSDQFHFAYNTGVTNYAVAIARVATQENTDPWAKAGVMFRDSTAANSMFAMAVATPGNGVSFQWRSATGGSCLHSGVGGISVPVWVKVVRSGTDFSGYYSPDGLAWTPIGPPQEIGMRESAPVGLAVTAHDNADLSTATFTGVVTSNTPAPPPPAPVIFGVYRQLWTGIASGTSLDYLTNTANNPNWPNNPDAAYTKSFTNFETEVNFLENYGQRVRTLVVPPADGNYTFWISSDDASELFLSTDETPANRVSIAGVSGWTSSREWGKYAGQQSAPRFLEAGRRYYLEAQMVEGGGGDNLAVRWQLPNASFEEPLTAQSAAGTFLIPFDGVDVQPGFYQQTGNLTVTEGQHARFSVLVTNKAPVSYQWTRNGVNISGATKAFFTVSNVTVAANDGQIYRCVAANSAGSATTASMVLSVNPDIVKPLITRVMNVGATNVQIVYSESVEAATATNKNNYVFTNGLAVTRVQLSSDNVSVMLTTSTLIYGSNYTILVSNVRDRASAPNTILANTPAVFTAQPYAIQEIGNPPIAASITANGNGVDLTASGSDIGGYSDQLGFGYSVRSGDFDVAVRLAGLSLPDLWAKAGLMARETLDAGSRFAAVFATPSMNGCFFQWRDPVNAYAGSQGNFPANYPYTWLRLKRASNTFTGFASYDGQTWTQLGTAIIAMPSQVYFGMAVSSHNSAQAAVAQFRDLREVTGGTIAATALPHEPPGPSSRKTPIAITEIMFKPPPRADLRNVEFIEIYNSNPWFQDIGGYRLQGDNLDYTFPAGTTIQGGAYLVVAAVPADVQAVYGVPAMGPYTGSLKNPDTIVLYGEHGAALLEVPYESEHPWPVGANDTGHSLVLANPTYGEADPRAWDISDAVWGSPGNLDPYRPSPLRHVVINEFLAHTDLPDVDYIELYNHANQAVDIGGCILTDSAATDKYVIPAGTTIPARGFVFFTETQLNFALNAAGETIFLKNPDSSRVLDAVEFGAQEEGVSSGRWPDGAAEFYRLAAKTAGTNNSAIRISNVVINELMYHPISDDDDDQYVEIYNRGAQAVNLAGWQLSDGISFTFPVNTVLAPDAYLVVARDINRLRSSYAVLNLTNSIGNYSGRLSHGGERVALRMPESLVSTNSQGLVSTNYVSIAVHEVTYQTGGRWGQWADGGGSSLELINPNVNPRLAPSWADSDETAKSSWVNIETTGQLMHGANYESGVLHAQIGLLDPGECLVDDVEVRQSGGANLVINPTFESGLGGWSLQGACVRSSLETTGYGGSSRSLHIRASSRLWTGANSCQADLNPSTLDNGSTATLRFKARWLRGCRETLLRLNGNWLETSGLLPVPANLGTPGARNSRYVANAGPAIFEVTHTPALPAAFENAVVTARIYDASTISSFNLNYRLDPGTTYTTVAMRDDGTLGDAIAKDGVYSATIPGQAANALAAFYLSATDTLGGSARFPALLNNGAPPPEAVVMFGDSNPGGSFATYHLWVTQTNANRWSELYHLSNESHDCTVVSGRRVVYNVQARFAGSPYHPNVNTPYGNLCHYKWTFPDDDKFLGATSFNKIHQHGNGAGDDGSLQREQLANTFLRALGVPWLNRRSIIVYVNGNRRGQLMEDAQTPGDDVIEQYFPDDPDGWLFKMQPWFEFGPYPFGTSIPFANMSWVNMMPYTDGAGNKVRARYRFNFLSRESSTHASDFSRVFSMVDAASSYGTPNYVANMEQLADMENWMRVFAANHAAGNWDAYGCVNAQNLYGYIGTQGTKYSLLMFDFNIVLGNSGSWGPGENLFSVNGQDPNTQNIYNEPAFRRMYWRALEELVHGPLDLNVSGPLVDAKYSAFQANGITAENPNAALKSWLSSAQSSIAAQLAAANVSAFTVNTTVNVTNDVGYVTGTAPMKIKSVWINGAEYPIVWTSPTTFRVAVPLRPGVNNLQVVGVDRFGQAIPGATGSVSVSYSGTLPSIIGNLVISEVMVSPPLPGAEYVELFNNSSNTTFDLSGLEFRGIGYTFPAGSVIGPRKHLVLAADPSAFAAAYGALIPVFDIYSGTLQDGGETLTLLWPTTGITNDLVVSKVRFDTQLPWPLAANNTGTSLQLIDPRQDNWRAGNWSVSTTVTATPSALNSVNASIPIFPALWINEVQAENFSGPTNSAGQRTPWLEIFNPTTNTISLSGLYLSGNYSNLLQWAFPAGASIEPRQFKTIFADGQTGLSTLSELHASFVLPAGNGSVALSRVYNGQPQVLDYVNYASLGANHSYGSFPDGQSFDRMEFFYLTPGETNNNTSAPLTVALNEWMADNSSILLNPVTGNYNDWFELYNYGTNPANLAGYFLTDDLSVKFKFEIPSGYTIPAGGFLLVWADDVLTNGTPELHVPFKLSKAGSDLALFGGDGNAVDFVQFGAQTENLSQGRFPDGSVNIFTFTQSSAGTNNIGPNLRPALVQPASQTVTAGQTLSFTLQATDDDEPPQTLTFSLGAGAPAGAVVNPTSGLFTWTPTAGQAPSTNQITAMVTDNGSPALTDSKVFTVVVNPANQPPVLSLIPDQAIYANTLLGFTANATDADFPAQTLTFSLGAGAPAGASITPDGVFSWIPTAAQAPSTNTIAVIVWDSGVPQMSATNSFQVVVYRPNTAPVLGTISNQTVYADTLLTFTASATDTDEPPQTLTFSLGAGAPAGANLTPDGLFSWIPTAAQAPSTNTIAVIVWDSGVPQMSDTNSFQVVVYRPNTAPVLGAISNQTVYANTLLTFTASVTDTDQPPQILTFSLGSGAPAGASITTNGVFSWTPTAAQAPSTNTIAVIVWDSGLPQMSDTNSFQVVVYRPNTAPVLGAISNHTVYANTLLTFTASVTDTDQPPQTLTFSLGAGAPVGASMTTNGVFSWTPTTAQAPSTNTVAVIVWDSGVPQMSDTNSFQVVVYRPNTAPVLGTISNRTVYADTLLTFTASVTDTDEPPQTLTFSLGAGAPAGASITTNGVFSWTPTSAQAPSTNTIAVIVRDSGVPQMSDTNSFVATVLQTNQTASVVLQWAETLNGSFTDLTNAVLDEGAKTITTTSQTATAFYRLRAASQLRIAEIRINGNQVIIRYE